MTQLVACGRCRWWRSAKGRRVVSRRAGSGSGERESGQHYSFPFIHSPSASPHRKPPISRHCAPGRPNWQPDHHGIGDRGNEPTDWRTSLLARIGVVHTYHMPDGISTPYSTRRIQPILFRLQRTRWISVRHDFPCLFDVTTQAVPRGLALRIMTALLDGACSR